MKYTLILLNDNKNILVSNEIVNEKEFYYKDGKISKKIENVYGCGNDDVEKMINQNNFYSNIKANKIIAGIESLPTLTYSNEVKQILRDKYGWVDVEDLRFFKDRLPYYDRTDNESHEDYLLRIGERNGFIEGFKANQSITNKIFSLKDVKLIWKSAKQHQDNKRSKEHQTNPTLSFEQLIESLQQPIELNVEVEMKCLNNIPEKDHTCVNKVPKITNNSILITKIL